jgi:hypothetical protein
MVGGGLSLRYEVLLAGAPVQPETVFHPGDAVRLSMAPGGDGYLYVVERLASGDWQLRFGSKVEVGKAYLVPPQAPLRYAESGRKTWLALLSRQPESDLAAARLEALVSQARGAAETASEGGPLAVEITLDFRE